MDDLFLFESWRNLLFLPPPKKQQERLFGQPLPPDPDPRRPFAPKFRQDLVELYAAGEEPRPDVNECHRSMRGAIYYIRGEIDGGGWAYKNTHRGWWQLKYFWNFQPEPWGNDPI